MSNQKVFVQDRSGEPLMPTKPAKARHLLEKGKAEVVERMPFTIQLNYKIKGKKNREKTTLGIDAGYSKVGFSVVTENKELIAGEMELRDDISRKLEQRMKYRKNRRSRNTRYRKPRFDNRSEEDWLAPSIKHKKNTHIKLVEKLKEILPIDEVVMEVAKFDQQKMQNPEICGKEYQQGTLKEYNIKNYLLEKFDYECAYCGKGGVPLEVEHIVPKSRGGTDRVSNLAISCHKCNQEKSDQTAEEFGHPKVQEKAENTLKETAFMNQVRWKIVNELGCNHTFGHITKKKRIELGLEKSHINDAFIIAGGKNQERAEPYIVEQNRRNNRLIQTNRKGYGRSIRRERYDLQPGDLVEVEKKGLVHSVKGVFNYGKWVRLVNRWGEKVNSSIKEVSLLKYGAGLQFSL
ncbi:paclitaxel/taxanoid biosynthesis susceptibility protein TS1 [archaeon SCG-AAA382B04]|nr:paclitaxel/taxanoid biosynthesis susceptibility protein TS1 [archaeon SCG-AAA382B04]